MTIQQLQTDIKNNITNNIYIFTGSEYKVKQIYIDKIIENNKADKILVNNLYEIYNNLGKKAFTNTKKCYIIYYDEDIIKQDENVYKDLIQRNKDDIIIFIYQKVDMKTNFYKFFKDYIIEFDKLTENVLINHIKKEIDLDIQGCKILIDLCDGDYSIILYELNKIKNYNINNSVIENFKDLLKQDAIHSNKQFEIFEFINSILDRNANKTYDLLKYNYNVDYFSIYGLLYNNIRQLLAVESIKNKSNEEIAKSSGLTSYQVLKAREKLGKYTLEELKEILRLLSKFERDIKAGLIDSKIALDLVLINLI